MFWEFYCSYDNSCSLLEYRGTKEKYLKGKEFSANIWIIGAKGHYLMQTNGKHTVNPKIYLHKMSLFIVKQLIVLKNKETQWNMKYNYTEIFYQDNGEASTLIIQNGGDTPF